MGDYKRPAGDITTLLDITDRDVQDNDFFPLDTKTTWFTRSNNRRNIPFVPIIQQYIIHQHQYFIHLYHPARTIST